jgi:hypothetical protein
MGSVNTQATRSTLTSVDTTLSENITATQNYIPVASTTNFSTSVVAEIESTNEVVSFASITSNQLTHSEEFDNNASWTKSNTSVTANSTTAPNGTTTADTLTESVNTGTQQIYKTGGLSYTANTVSTWSIFLKNNTRRYAVVICANGSTNWFYAVIDLQTGLQTASGSGATGTLVNFSISDEGSGWYRCALTGSTQGATNIFPKIILSDVANPTIASFGNYSRTGDGTSSIFMWGAQFESTSSATGYLPTSNSALVGLTTVTRGVNGTTAQAASSGDSIQQLPYALGSLDMPIRLRAISVSPDGTGAARLTLCDNNGDTLCDVDIPDGKSYTLNLPEDGIIFPNGIFVSNTDNITAYTVYTEKYSGPSLTS